MRRRLLVPIVLIAVLVLLALGAGGWFLYRSYAPAGAPAAQADAASVQVATLDGETVLSVPAEIQRASGIAVSALAPAQVQPQRLVYASVIDPLPLFDLRTRMAAARSELGALRNQAGVSAAQAARMQTLFEDDRNASQKTLQEARAAAQADQAKVAAAEATLAGLETSARQQFGPALARAAAAPGAGPWRQLASSQAALLRVVFPTGGAAPDSVAVEAPAGGTLTAHALSAAPQVDPMLQGAAYFYLVAAPLPVGTRTVAHAAGAPPGAAGVLVPDDAIVWYGDTRWTYVRTAPDRFTRRLVQAVAPAAGGVLAASGLRAGDAVVTRGAALLLSEELRPRGIATQCKDPPECDD